MTIYWIFTVAMASGGHSRTVETLAGLSAGFFTTLVAHPLDFFKLRLQLDSSNTNQIQSFKKIYESLITTSLNKQNKFSNFKFITNLYRGIGPNLVGSTSAWALYFLFYRHYKNLILNYSNLNDDKNLKPWHFLISAFAAGWTTSIITNPIWVIKTRMISTNKSSPGAYNSIIDGFKQIFKNEGILGFYRGLIPALFNVAQGAVQVSLYDVIKKEFIDNENNNNNNNNNSLSNSQYLFASASSKMISTCIFYPLQVIRSRLQILKSSNFKNYSTITTLSIHMYQREGFGAFYKGLLANLIRVVPATCTTFLIYEKVKQFCT